MLANLVRREAVPRFDPRNNPINMGYSLWRKQLLDVVIVH
jgi:hypothetical protein